MICEIYFNKALKNIEIYHGNTKQKKAGVAILILDKVDFIEVKSLHDDKGINSSRRYKNSKYLCT